MAQPSRIEADPVAAVRPHPPRVAELLRRIEELEALAEEEFGSFHALDWWLCALLAVVLPLAGLLWFGR